ncbi:MAG: hypothetical protein KJ600_02400 [Nanoarchaeota archaeon]|nr:hypothetical protein [Nanoarchaeota archaeon]MBU1103384.1 hypothetical protein [Nanoarchaeota archaeon]
MVLEKIYPAAEEWVFVDGEFDLPQKLLKEIRGFVKRNSLGAVAYRIENKEPVSYCCQRCLKAHLSKKVKRMNLDKNVMKKLTVLLDCESGHGGYYVDGVRLVRV